MYFGCCSVVFLAALLSVSLGERRYGRHLAYKCLNTNPSSPEKPPVIMLHGVADVKETWDGIYQKIPLLTGRKVCIYDARNHGESSWNNTLTVDVLAEDLEYFMDSLNIKKASLVGHDLGAYAAMRFALNNPKRVDSIFAEDTRVGLPPEDAIESFIQLFRALLESLAAVPPYEDPKSVVQAVIENYIRITGQPPPEFIFNRFPFRRCHGRWQWKANLELIIQVGENPEGFIGTTEGLYTGPAFFIYGTLSAFRILEEEELIRTFFPKAEFFGIEGADHFIHQNFPEVFMKKLVEFLNRTGPPKNAVKPCSGGDEIPNRKPVRYGGKRFFRDHVIANSKYLKYDSKTFI